MAGLSASPCIMLNCAAGLAAFLQIALVVLLRRMELAGRGDLRDDGPLVASGSLELLLGCPCGCFLLRIVEEHRGPVLRAEVRPLPVQGSRIMDPPEYLE